jgi:hypothetical protein
MTRNTSPTQEEIGTCKSAFGARFVDGGGVLGSHLDVVIALWFYLGVEEHDVQVNL